MVQYLHFRILEFPLIGGVLPSAANIVGSLVAIAGVISQVAEDNRNTLW